ncbi:MAG: hypothetical protein Roseis2KO_24480 [Roseivirga sp.]
MSQTTNAWKTLAKVDYKTRFDELTQFEEEYPIFSEAVKALDGTEITVEGWMIPLDELRGENYFVLSSLPFANCFFCGGAGPETVMEIFSKKQIDFTEKKIKVTGKLKINADDPLRLMYILSEARLID